MGEPATQPSLSPLTELNELSILSVLEENSWERPEGGGGGRDKGKEFSSDLDRPATPVQPYPSASAKGSRPRNAPCPASSQWGTGRLAQP